MNPSPELVAASDVADAFAGCNNRVRLAAAIGAARVTGTVQGLGVGAVVGVVAGFVLYVARARKAAR